MPEANENIQQLQQFVQKAFEEAPSLYANGFINGLGVVDSYIVFQTNRRATIVVNMSLSMAKTLGQSLLTQVERFEKETGKEVPTMEQLSKLITSD